MLCEPVHGGPALHDGVEVKTERIDRPVTSPGGDKDGQQRQRQQKREYAFYGVFLLVDLNIVAKGVKSGFQSFYGKAPVSAYNLLPLLSTGLFYGQSLILPTEYCRISRASVELTEPS